MRSLNETADYCTRVEAHDVDADSLMNSMYSTAPATETIHDNLDDLTNLAAKIFEKGKARKPGARDYGSREGRK